MKKITYTVGIAFALLTTSNAVAQQGFGTNRPDKSSAVEIKSPNKGLLIPRITLTSDTDVTTIANPANSLLVYNIGTAVGMQEGYYYYKAGSTNKWIPLVDSSNQSNTTVSHAGDNLSVVGTPTTNQNGSVTTNYEVKIVPGEDKQFLASYNDNGTIKTKWVSYNDVITSNVLASTDNKLKSTVNGVASNEVDIINTNELTVAGTTLTSTVNGVDGSVELKEAIQTGQIKYEVTAGTGVTIDPAGSTADFKTFKVSADAGAITLAGDVTGAANNNTVEKIQNFPVSTTQPTTGQVLKEVSGVWTPSTLTVTDVTEGKKLSSTDLSISTLDNKALLQDLTIDINNDAVTAVKLNDDTAGAGLIRNTTTKALDVNAKNGIKVEADFVKLGGELTEATEIITDNTNTLAIEGLQDFTGDTKTVVVLGTDNVLQKTTISTLNVSDAIVTKTADYTATLADGTILVNATTGNVTVTLPAAAEANKGKRFYVKLIATNTANTNEVRISSASSIDGLPTGAAQIESSSPFQSWLLQSDGTAWFVVGN